MIKRSIQRENRQQSGTRRVYLLPNLFTTGNIVCGLLSIMFAIQEQYGGAAYAILIGCLFDLLDGRIARLTGTGSTFGVNYDSLADLVTFGVAPGVMIYQFFYRPHDKLLLAVVIIYTVSCALRLARFNVKASTTEKKGFKGLPTPSAAAMIATIFLCVFLTDPPLVSRQARFAGLVMQALALALAGLMVSDIPYPALGSGVFRKRHPFHYLVIVLITVGFIIANPPLTLFMIFSAYIVYGPTRQLMRNFHRSDELTEESETLSETGNK